MTIAVAVACWNHLTPTVVDRTRTVADAALIQGANAIVNIVAHSIAIGIRRARAATDAQRIKLETLAVALACRDYLTSTSVNRTGAIADAALIEGANAIVNIVAYSIAIGIRSA